MSYSCFNKLLKTSGSKQQKLLSDSLGSQKSKIKMSLALSSLQRRYVPGGDDLDEAKDQTLGQQIDS